MQIIIPMAGFGEGFSRAGHTAPKPLIEVDGKPMIEHVVNLFPEEKKFIFLCSSNHLISSQMKEVLFSLKPRGRIFGINPKKLGPVHGISEILNKIDDKDPVIVNYCDFNMFWSFDHFKEFVKRENPDGIIVCYKGFHPHLIGHNLYAGVNTDIFGKIVSVKEKYSFSPNKFDSWHSNGTYYFKSGALMKKYFTKMIKSGKKVNGEYYVSMAYDLMLRDGLDCLVYPIDYFCQWGTPEDLQDYNYWSEYFNERTGLKTKR